MGVLHTVLKGLHAGLGFAQSGIEASNKQSDSVGNFSACGRGLPQLYSIFFEIPYPGETPKSIVLLFGIDAHAGGSQLSQQFVQIVHAEVDHGLLGAIAEVGRGQGEVVEDGRSG